MKIFYAEQFEALRRNCGIDEQFVDSLARCVKWNSSGGKSGSGFMKSKGLDHCPIRCFSRLWLTRLRAIDDRFIIKEISRLEMDALLKFAPSYFQYMSNAFTASVSDTCTRAPFEIHISDWLAVFHTATDLPCQDFGLFPPDIQKSQYR